MIIDYSAACGLLGGLRRNSFGEEDLSHLEKEEFSGLKESLKKYLGEYYPLNDEISHLERALYVSCIKKTIKLLKFLPPEAHRLLKALLSEFDILNLKLLIRQIKLGINCGTEMFYWGFSFLAFKDKDPSGFKDIDALEHYLKKSPVIRRIFLKALSDLKFHKDIFYFDIRLDREYLNLLKNISLGLDSTSGNLIRHYVSIKLLLYALRMRFFQGREPRQIRSAIGELPLAGDSVLSESLNAVSLEDALSVVDKSSFFSRFKRKLSLDFEEDMEGAFYDEFLRKKGINFFSAHPYLVFYLSQRYFIERLIFIMNDKLN